MSFTEILKETVESVGGAVSAMIIAVDGIPVEVYNIEKLVDADNLGAQASTIIKNVEGAASDLSAGDVREFTFVSDLCGIIMRKINKDYYFALVIKPDGNYGKGRFALKRAVPKIETEF